MNSAGHVSNDRGGDMRTTFTICSLAALLMIAGCAPLSVHVLSKDDFTRYSAPQRIAVVPVNDTDAARRVTDDLTRDFAAAGFTVIPRSEVEGQLSMHNVVLRDAVAKDDAVTIGAAAMLDAVVLVRQFYGTELRMIETRSGKTLAAGCWRTSPVRIVNEMVDQIRKNDPASRWCPVPAR